MHIRLRLRIHVKFDCFVAEMTPALFLTNNVNLFELFILESMYDLVILLVGNIAEWNCTLNTKIIVTIHLLNVFCFVCYINSI
jgi:hypothetical protein